MKRTIKFLSLTGFFLIASAYDSFAQSLDDVVYVCLNQGTKYHINRNCSGLGNCKVDATSTTLQEAINGLETNKGKTSFTFCKKCSKSYRYFESEVRAGKVSSSQPNQSKSKNSGTSSNAKSISKQQNIGTFNNRQ